MGCHVNFRVSLEFFFNNYFQISCIEIVINDVKCIYFSRPTTNAIMGLTFASYITKPLFPYCAIPDAAIRLIAAAAIC